MDSREGDPYNSRTFFNLENRSENRQAWIPGFFLTNSGKRNFKIQPVRDV